MIEYQDKFYKEIRCAKCRKLLGLEYIFRGRLLLKCPKCKEMNHIEYKTPIGRIERLEAQNLSNNNEIVMKREYPKNGKEVSGNG